MSEKTLQILLVEKNPEDIERISHILENADNFNMQLTTIMNMSSLDVICKENHFDIMLLDLYVSDSQGLQTIEKAHAIAHDIPIIVLTDLDDEAFSIDAVHHGVQDYLVKSLLDPASLPRSILYAIERNGLRLALRAQQEHAQYLATHDELTALPNRKLFLDRLDQQLARYARYQDGFALMFIDLDHLKQVNDKLGHAIGDKLLQTVAGRLKQVLRKTDTISRMGGDEFVVMITHLLDVNNVLIVADKVLEIFNQEFVIQDKRFPCHASIGIALVPQDGIERDDLLNKADQAMYRVKHSGGRGYQLYNPQSLVAS